jgi:hypothetical protein
MFNMTTRNYENDIASVKMWYASDSLDAPVRLQITSNLTFSLLIS